MLCELPGVDMYLHWLSVSGVPVCCSNVCWCLVLQGVGVDSTVVVSIFVVIELGRGPV
jgi:hypothetical protein